MNFVPVIVIEDKMYPFMNDKSFFRVPFPSLEDTIALNKYWKKYENKIKKYSKETFALGL